MRAYCSQTQAFDYNLTIEQPAEVKRVVHFVQALKLTGLFVCRLAGPGLFVDMCAEIIEHIGHHYVVFLSAQH